MKVDQPFWTAARGILTTVAPAQLVSFLMLCCLLKVFAIVARKKISLQSVLAVSIGGSFFLWPHIYLLAGSGHVSQLFANFFQKPIAVTVGIVFLIPLLLNQLSLLLLIGLIPLWLMADSSNNTARWLGYVGLLFILPSAWFLDCFSEAPL